MSRVANSPVALPSGVEVKMQSGVIEIKVAKAPLRWLSMTLLKLSKSPTSLRLPQK